MIGMPSCSMGGRRRRSQIRMLERGLCFWRRTANARNLEIARRVIRQWAKKEFQAVMDEVGCAIICKR